ncbi:BCCT family transporter [Aeromonas caviae]|uniref:BCCT family transporter n=1 Tax=Aeromonas caviae TaxID=648 RepID=UPI001BD6A3C7|nr:BCCT family transporter [Aeromonas caviae]MBS4721044.1 BCCT family transporter [Aeromonas caviae]
MNAPRPPRCTLSQPIFIPGLLFILALLAICSLAPEAAARFFGSGQSWIAQHFSWFYVLVVGMFLILLLVIAFSHFGNIRLGPDDARPEFSFTSWLAMLFAAGMGIGLMYFGVGEPMSHFVSPPQATPLTQVAAREAMVTTFFHWGFHAWAVYAIVGLVLAYFGFRYNLPLTIRSGLYPIFKEKIHGPLGHAVDVFALVGTIFGIATTLGYGVMQLSAGITRLTGMDTSGELFRFGLIGVVIALAGISAVTGLDKGVKRLSELNLFLAIVLLLFVLVAGPTQYLLGALSENIGNYVSSLSQLTFRTFTYSETRQAGWFGNWTLLYWAWWISWSPFVGLFIARISRGRTLREFILGVLFVPTAFNLLWMTVFGNAAIWASQHEGGTSLIDSVGNIDTLLFNFFDLLPGADITSALAVILISVFFVTSADSGAFVIDNIATQGKEGSPVWQRLFWALLLGVTAGTLMSTGGLAALQSMTLIAALPFAFIMVLLCLGLCRGLVADKEHSARRLSPATDFWNGKQWRTRMDHLLRPSTEQEARAFVDKIALPALTALSQEFAARGITSRVEEDGPDQCHLLVPQQGRRDFCYGVRIEARPAPAFNPLEAAHNHDPEARIFEPITYFADGRAGYDIQYLTRDELSADVLRQYERYLVLSQDEGQDLLSSAPEHTQPTQGE